LTARSSAGKASSFQLSGRVAGYVYGAPGTVIAAGLSVFVLLDGSFLIAAGAPKGFPLVASIGQCLIDQIAGIDGVTIDREKGAPFRFFGNREPAWARSRPLITTSTTPAGSSLMKAGCSPTISDVPAQQADIKDVYRLPAKKGRLSLFGNLPDLGLNEAADGAKVINAGNEDPFWYVLVSVSYTPSPD
jgi:hypothetical protein